MVECGAGDDGASHGVLIISLTSSAFGADALNEIVSWCAVAKLRVEVVDLVGSALDAADLVVDIIGLSGWACCAEVVDQIESRFADASGQNPILVGSTDGSTHSVAALTA